MTNMEYKQCKSKDCNNPVLDGKYCKHCKQERKEKRGNFLKAAGPTAAGIASIVLTVILKRKPK